MFCQLPQYCHIVCNCLPILPATNVKLVPLYYYGRSRVLMSLQQGDELMVVFFSYSGWSCQSPGQLIRFRPTCAQEDGLFLLFLFDSVGFKEKLQLIVHNNSSIPPRSLWRGPPDQITSSYSPHSQSSSPNVVLWPLRRLIANKCVQLPVCSRSPFR